MKALSDPNRVKIVKMLQHKIMCVCELTEALQLAQPTVSKHLRILEEAGLVESKRDGSWVNYYLKNGERGPYVSNMLGRLRQWLEDDPIVMDLKQQLPNISRENIYKG